MQTKPYEYESEFAPRYFRQGVDRGREEGREEWARRATVAAVAADVFVDASI